jgi:ASC-1-like (ASCH) protein
MKLTKPFILEDKMIHEMKLNDKPFNDIKTGKKKFELRLYDDKRKKINLGDTIIFRNTTNMEDTISVTVIALLQYPSFADFFNDIDYRLSGTANNLKEKLERIHSFYTFEEEREHGILAIKIQLL